MQHPRLSLFGWDTRTNRLTRIFFWSPFRACPPAMEPRLKEGGSHVSVFVLGDTHERREKIKAIATWGWGCWGPAAVAADGFCLFSGWGDVHVMMINPQHLMQALFFSFSLSLFWLRIGMYKVLDEEMGKLTRSNSAARKCQLHSRCGCLAPNNVESSGYGYYKLSLTSKNRRPS